MTCQKPWTCTVADLFTDEAERAFAYLRDFAKIHYEFLGSHVVKHYARDGNPALSEITLWRCAAARAVEERIICQMRLTPAGAANPPPAPIWRSLIYRGSSTDHEERTER